MSMQLPGVDDWGLSSSLFRWKIGASLAAKTSSGQEESGSTCLDARSVAWLPMRHREEHGTTMETGCTAAGKERGATLYRQIHAR